MNDKFEKQMEKSLKKASKNILISLVIFFMILSATFAYLWLTEVPSPLNLKENEPDDSTVDGDENSTTDPTLIKNNDGTYSKVLTETSCDVEVYYLDLEKENGETEIGDSTYIKCGNIDILIDAGKKNPGSHTVVPFLKEKVTDKTIDILIATHTDDDHIGGFDGLSQEGGVLEIEDFTYKYILESGFVTDTNIYERFMELIDNTTAKICTPIESMNGTNQCPSSFILGDAKFEILDTRLYALDEDRPNDRSIVTLLTHNEVNFLFPGDLEDDELFASTIDFHVDIFKAAHHGASSANSSTLLNALTPDVVILSTDGDNSYDIPQQASLDRIYAVTDDVYATFTTGTIKITSNGTTYNIEAEENLILFQDTDWFEQNRTLNTN